MSFTVLWLPDAEQRLAEIWLRASDPAVVADAANRLDQALRHDPDSVGESRTGKRKVAYCLPLGIDFIVGDKDRVVIVVNVWYCTKNLAD